MNRNTTLLAVLAGVCALVCFGLNPERPARGGQDKPEEKVKTITLKSIYSTSGQEGLKDVKRRLEEPYGKDLEEIYRETKGMGASNLFLARGQDIVEVVNATLRVFTGCLPADVPAEPFAKPKTKELWLVVYFGVMGSGPPGGWLLQGVERNGTHIKAVYVKRSSEANDMHQYFAWVPLGALPAGTYTLELFDGEKKEVTLLRRVTVSEN